MLLVFIGICLGYLFHDHIYVYKQMAWNWIALKFEQLKFWK